MRKAEHSIDPRFTERWSPRGFDPDVILPEEDLHRLFEAARWAPSSSNEQPWVFYFEKDKTSRELFLSFLTDGNKYWVKNASRVIIVCARKNFAASGKPNPHAWFDAGAAWMSLALQARVMGFFAHAMAGIHREVIAEKLQIDTGALDIVAAIAVGKLGKSDHLSEKHRAGENPNDRKRIEEFTFAV